MMSTTLRVISIMFLGAGVIGMFSALFGKDRKEAAGVPLIALLLSPAALTLMGVSLLNLGQPWTRITMVVAVVMYFVGSSMQRRESG